MSRQLDEMIDEMKSRMQAAQARTDERATHALILDGFRKKFGAGNPTFAWLAYHFCSKAKTPGSMWVSGYLDDVAAKVLHLIRRPSARDVGTALALALGMKTGRGATGALTAAKHADEASELLRVYQMFRFAGLDYSTAWKKLLAVSRASSGLVLEERTIRRRLDEHCPGWRELDFEPPHLASER